VRGSGWPGCSSVRMLTVTSRCGAVRGEPVEGVGQQRVRGPGEHRDPQLPGGAGGQVDEIGLCLLEAGQHGVGVADEDVGGGCEAYAAADAFQQPRP
jgi:hypothetical protein